VLTSAGLDAIQSDLVRQYNANEISYAQFTEQLAHVKMMRGELEHARELLGPDAMLGLPHNESVRPLVNNPYLHPGENPFFEADRDERSGTSASSES